MSRIEFDRLASFLEWSQEGHSFDHAVLYGLDLTGQAALFAHRSVQGMLLLGCRAEGELLAHLITRGALFFPLVPGLPYHTYRTNLYTVEELFDPSTFLENYQRSPDTAYGQTLDGTVYKHFSSTGRSCPNDILESIAQRLHDHGITDAIEDIIKGKAVVGIMGGHGLLRTNPAYHQVAYLARELAQEKFFLVSGGGPGAMEACHLGAHFVDRSEAELAEALELLAAAPDFHQINDWLYVGLQVRARFPQIDPQRGCSLAVPTWYFGHEPPNVFATHIGKYFSNSVREDGLVTIARHGLVFAEGSAGTMQEIFQDQTQNYYMTEGDPSPMILLGIEFWTKIRPIYPLLRSIAVGKDYEDHVHASDSNAEIVDILKTYRATHRLKKDCLGATPIAH